MGEFLDFIKNALGVVLGFAVVGGVFVGLFWLFIIILTWATG